MILILEDSTLKIANLFMSKPKIFDKQTVCVMRTEIEAQLLMSTLKEPIILMLDNELDPGCGNGLSFLKFCVERFSALIKKVYIITMNNNIRAEMIHLCEIYHVDWQ